MIRIVTEFTPNGSKHLLVMCDNQNCGNYASREINPDKPIDQGVAEAVEVISQMYNFAVSLLGVVCPQHVEKARQQQQLVQPVSSLNGKNLISLVKH